MVPENKIRIGITGYGNLGKGVALAIQQNPDMVLEGIFTRRSPEQVRADAPVYSLDDAARFKGQIDVMILCGGSAKDLPEQSVQLNQLFNTVDSFDTHARIPEYFEAVEKSALKHGTLSLISTGWDPGLFSMIRLLGESVLPSGKTYTFWGSGLSQGHSDAIRRVQGVKMGAQYTIPIEAALKEVRSGRQPELTTAEKHRRVCYVVSEEHADKSVIENTIKNMPHYFEPYHTEVHFISEEEFLKNHTKMPHGGIVFRNGESYAGSVQGIEFSLNLESNPEFTSSVLVAFARATYKMHNQGMTGAITAFDVPLGLLSPHTAEDLRRELL